MGVVFVNTCTIGNLLCGFIAIVLATEGRLAAAAACILLSVLLDGLDGTLARRWSVATPFGAQLDSLADLATFGVAAAVVCYHWLGAGHVALAAGGLVAACAALRLARFNTGPADERYFTGVPTTIAALILTGCTLLPAATPPPAGPPLAVIAVLALLMVSPFPYPKLAVLRRIPGPLWLLPATCFAVLPGQTFVVFVLAYLTTGPLIWGRRSVSRYAWRIAESRDAPAAVAAPSSDATADSR
jgi:CDP-diacylglycerol---serine O-phosphatidyltransferase